MTQATRQKSTNIASLLIRIGLGLIFVYAGYSALREPELWVDFVPKFLAVVAPPTTILHVLSIFHLILAGWLVWGRLLWISAPIAAAMLIGIVVANPGVFIITFRDLGLGICALALLFLDPQAAKVFTRVKQLVRKKS